jgi:hypothetical protein
VSTAETKKCTFARSVAYPVGVKPAYVERTDQKENTEEKETYTGESYRVSEAQPENETDRLTEFVQGASKSGNIQDFVSYFSSKF